MHPFPSLSTFKKDYKSLFSVLIFTISLSGILNIWFFCSILIQRFSVPEFKSNKLTVHLMFIFGILANLIFILFGFSPEILKFEYSEIKILRISISMIIYLSFMFFNNLFAALTLNVLLKFQKQIAYNDKRLKRNIQGKKYLVYITLFLLSLYIISILMKYNINCDMKNNLKIKNDIDKIQFIAKNLDKEKSFNFEKLYELEKELVMYLKRLIDAILFSFPFFLFFFNSLINLSYYFDIVYVEDIINIIIDKDFFLSNDESNAFLSQFPIYLV